MKVVASILLMYFGLLMMQPFYNMDKSMTKPTKNCVTGTCYKQMSHHKKSLPCNDPSACNKDFCNPFVPCETSIVYRILPVNFVSPVLELSNNKKPAINEDIISDYLADCWRPPQLLS